MIELKLNKSIFISSLEEVLRHYTSMSSSDRNVIGRKETKLILDNRMHELLAE